jgi:Tfp pilus assembly protein FimT
MITSWADEEDKANAKYDAIRGKSKQNAGGGSGNNGNQGGRNNNNYYYYSGPNRKRKPDNTVTTIKRPAKENVGEFRKTRHPRNVKFDKVLETCFSG